MHLTIDKQTHEEKHRPTCLGNSEEYLTLQAPYLLLSLSYRAGCDDTEWESWKIAVPCIDLVTVIGASVHQLE